MKDKGIKTHTKYFTTPPRNLLQLNIKIRYKLIHKEST
jgi:hypothetical protein